MIRSFPVVEIEPTSHADRFSRWAKQFGIFRLARSLQVYPRTLQRWFGTSRRPDVDTAKTIIALSAVEPLDGTPLTFEDIYGPARATKVELRQVKKLKEWE